MSESSSVRYGINLMAWSGRIGAAELALLPGIAALGYDGVELPVLAPDAVDPAAVRFALAEAGLACSASGALPRGASLLVPAERERGVAWIERTAEVAAACGARVLCGPLYHPVGALPGRPPTAEEWESCVVGLRAAGERAAARGVVLAIEPLNRFETHFLNTIDDACRLLDAVDHPGVGLHLDTFHQNIEEKDLRAAIRRAGHRVLHVHVSENDRGTVGSGHVPWDDARDALRAIGYLDGTSQTPGWITAETFSGAVPEIAAATAIWRPIVPDPWAYARDSLAFTKRLLEGG
jgi:D-psicose/D-tagatose/L-ribulose 3-epimerase